jgi:hypothetical protein
MKSTSTGVREFISLRILEDITSNGCCENVGTAMFLLIFGYRLFQLSTRYAIFPFWLLACLVAFCHIRLKGAHCIPSSWLHKSLQQQISHDFHHDRVDLHSLQEHTKIQSHSNIMEYNVDKVFINWFHAAWFQITDFHVFFRCDTRFCNAILLLTHTIN